MTGEDKPRSFLGAFFLAGICLCLAVVAINVIVDPFWRFDLVDIHGFNAQKNQFPGFARLGKAGVVCRLQPRTVILGTSRVEVGINPTSAGFQSLPKPIYNLGLAGSGLHELDLTLRHAVYASPHLRDVFIGLDFLMFNANREAVVFNTEVIGFDPARLLSGPHDSCLRSLLHDWNMLLGPMALRYSWSTVMDRVVQPSSPSGDVSGWIANYDRNGFRNHFAMLDKVLIPVGGYRGLFGDNQERYYTKRVWRPPPQQRYCFDAPGQPDTLAEFRNILRFARKAGLRLHLFINPVHARLLLAIRDAGLWPQYEDWKRGLVHEAESEAAESGQPAFPIWDFSGFNSVTTERVPAAGDTKTIMRWFWEPSHYKSELGDLIIDKIMAHHDPKETPPADFGVLLNKDTIEPWIKRTREEMRRYMHEDAPEAAIVKAAVDDGFSGGSGANCGNDVAALERASVERAHGESRSAEEDLAAAVRIHEEDKRRYEALDVPYREVGFDHLLARYRAGREVRPPLTDWVAYQKRGIERADRGDYAGADDDFSEAIRIGPTDTALYYLRGTTRLSAGDPTGAAADFKAGLKLDPTNKTLKSLLARADASVDRSVPEEANSSTRNRSTEARQALKADGGVSIQAESARTLDPSRAVALQHAGDAKRQSGDYSGAIVDYTKAIEVSPPNTALYYLRGTARLAVGDGEGAARDFDDGLKLDPANATLRSLLVRARKIGHSRKSEPTSAVNPDRAVELQHAGDAKRASGDYPGAIVDYTKAIEVSPPNTALYYLRGTTRLEVGDGVGAARDFEAGLKLDPENVTLKSLLVRARNSGVSRKPDGAFAIDPGLAVELQHAGDAKRQSGDYPGAIVNYTKAIEVSPPNTALYYLRGTARLEVGDGVGAARDFEAGLKLDPGNATLRSLLSRARSSQQRKEKKTSP